MAEAALRMMAVHAHPDDEASKGAATMARYAAEGVAVRVVTCTGGERGAILNPRLADDEHVLANLPQVRRDEMAAAASSLGISHRWLGFVDSGLPEGDPLPPLPAGCFALVAMEEATERLVEQIRSFRPQVVTTYNEHGGYPHPDHIRCHEISVSAVRAAADPEQFLQAGPAWQVSKVYYDNGFSAERIATIHEALAERGLSSPFEEWLQRRDSMPRREVTTRVECADYFGERDDALRAHATQIDPEGFFFAVPRDIEREVWPFEEWELAHSAVPVSVPEDDLFAGLRDGEGDR